MYSVVLMAALTTGSTTPGWFFNGGCYGCRGGCWGCHGCYGGGCWGVRRISWGCHGCGGCFGCHGCVGRVTYSHGCRGCFGCAGCVGAACHGCAGGVVVRSAAPAQPAEQVVEPPKQKQGTAPAPANRARLIVDVPEDAKLYIDERPTKTANRTSRTFHTPELDSGNDYYYILRAEAVRDGKTVAETQRVIFRAGTEVRAAFRGLTEEGKTTATAAKLVAK